MSEYKKRDADNRSRIYLDRRFSKDKPMGLMAEYLKAYRDHDNNPSANEQLLLTIKARFLPLALAANKRCDDLSKTIAIHCIYQLESYIQEILTHCEISDPRLNNSKFSQNHSSFNESLTLDRFNSN